MNSSTSLQTCLDNGIKELNAGNLEQSLEWLNRGLSAAGDLPRDYLFLKACVLERLTRFEESRTALLEELRRYPENEQAGNVLGRVELQLELQQNLGALADNSPWIDPATCKLLETAESAMILLEHGQKMEGIKILSEIYKAYVPMPGLMETFIAEIAALNAKR